VVDGAAGAGGGGGAWPHDQDDPHIITNVARIVAAILTATRLENILELTMASIFSPIRLMIVFVCAALALFLPGCPPPHELNSAAKPNESTTDILRLRTDSLLHAMVLFQRDELKNFFPPGSNVDVYRQLDLYLQAPYPKTRVLGWNAENIIVKLSTDGRSARTEIRLELLASDPRAKPTQQEVTFEWQADEKGAVFYLIPIKTTD
jgi:hypothetical protein